MGNSKDKVNYIYNSSYGSLSPFLSSEISKYPLLSKEEELELGKIIATGNKQEAEEARNKLICSNLRLVHSIAKGFIMSDNSLVLDDLIQDGYQGLCDAANNYDYTKGLRFSTFATSCIKTEILKKLGNNKSMIKLPEKYKAQLRKIKKISAELTQKYNREPTYEEIAREYKENVTPEWIETQLILEPKFESLDKSDEDDKDKYEYYSDESNEEEEQEYSSSEILQAMKAVLNDIEYQVLSMRLQDSKISFSAIGEKIGKTKQRANQIYLEANKKLKEYLTNEKKRD